MNIVRSNIDYSSVFQTHHAIENLISIIIPVFNAELYISRCIESIINQTYKNFEIIIIDDGSTDNTCNVIASYTKIEKRIRYVKIKNGGVSKARNTGLKLALGEFIQLVDADDYLNSNYLLEMHRLITTNQADVAICRFHHPVLQSYVQNDLFDLSNKEQFISLYSDTFAWVVPWNKLWRRTCIKVPFDTNVHFAEDELFNLANLVYVKRAITTGQKLYHYYVSDQSCVNKAIQLDIKYPTEDQKNLVFSRIQSLQIKRRYILENAIKHQFIPFKQVNEIEYFRIIDFFFWHLTLYFFSGATIERLIKDTYFMLNHDSFIKAFATKENLGFKLNMSKALTLNLIIDYINQCNNAFQDVQQKSEIKLVNIFRTLFLLTFVDIKTLDTVFKYDLDAQLYSDFLHSKTPEADYVSKLLN